MRIALRLTAYRKRARLERCPGIGADSSEKGPTIPYSPHRYPSESMKGR